MTKASPLIAWVLVASACAHGGARHDPLPARGSRAALTRPERVAYSTADELLPTLTGDGGTIAYVTTETGNLDVFVRVTGGAARPVTLSASDDFDPSFGPLSGRLVYASRERDALGDVYLGEGGDARALTDGRTADRQPVFSPDERRVYFTRATPPEEERVAVYDLDADEVRVVSPTPGFDPAPAPRGDYLLYTAPAGVAGRPHPHVVALRLADGATRAVTLGESPAGFGKFAAETASTARVVMVRFPDDDDGDGAIDAHDQASLWAVDVALDRLFARAGDGDRAAVGTPRPLTAGTADELFPCPSGPWLYFTESAGDEQNISRLPLDGMFPPVGADELLALAEELEDPRERWFAYRAAAARLDEAAPARARLSLAIAQIHLDAGARGLARAELAELARLTADATHEGERGEVRALGALERLGLDREERLARAAGARERDRILADVAAALERVDSRTPRVEARSALERAELRAAAGDRAGALAVLDGVIADHAAIAPVAGRALLRRTELLGVDFDPQALAEAYGEVIARYPGERRLVQEAARRIVDAWAGAPEDAVASLRRLIGRTSQPWVRWAARERVTERLRASGALDLAAVEQAALVEDAEAAGDRRVAARAQRARARLEEQRGASGAALAAWTRLRDAYADLPGAEDEAREAITRVALEDAAAAEAAGRAEDALASYRAVLANDPRQVKAHRRALALSAALGRAEAAAEERRAARDADPNDAIARYAYGLALTYLEPPDLEAALEELEASVDANPLSPAGLLALGWVEEMLHQPKDDLLTRAIEHYGRAVRVARDALDPQVEAEGLLDLGNARWRLAEGASDAGNFYAAFRAYMDLLSTSYRFERPEAELVFWERLARAAAYAGEWAVAAMAGREAASLAESTGQKARLAQIWATLALTYTRAQEPGYAEQALGNYAAALSEDERPARLAIAERNRAMAKLDALERDGVGDASDALADLAKARRRFDPQVLRAAAAVEALLRAEQRDPRGRVADFDAGRPSGSVIATVPDATRAPFGFDAEDELDLNLAASTRALRGRGDRAAAAAVDRARLALVEKRLDDESSPALSRIREWLGLALADVRDRACLREDDTCRAAMSAVRARVEAMVASDNLEKLRPHLRVERARVLALALEVLASRAHVGPVREDAPEVMIAGEDEAIAESLEDTRRLALAPPDAESVPTGELTRTSSASLVALGPLALDAAQCHARLLHAAGLRALARAESGLGGRDLAATLASLDGALPALTEARRSFAESAAVARRVPTAIAARIAALAAHGEAESARLGAPQPAVSTASVAPGAALVDTGTVATTTAATGVARAEDAAAIGLARALGAPALAARLRVAAVLAAGDDEQLAGALGELEHVWPDLLPAGDLLLDRAFARARGAAVARGDAEGALTLFDRGVLLRLSAEGARALPAVVRPADVELMTAARAALAQVRAAERGAAAPEGETPREAWIRLANDRARLVAAHARLADVAALSGSIAARARLLAEPASPDDVRAALSPTQDLLVPIEVDGRVVALWVTGSTTAEEGLTLRPCALEGAALRAALKAADESGRAQARIVGDALLATAPRPARELVLALGDMGVWSSPAALFPGRAVSIVSTPTALAAAVEAQSVGLRDAWALEGSAAPARTATVSAEDLRSLARADAAAAARTGPLDARTVPERLRGRPVGLYVVGARVVAPEVAPERARVVLAAEGEGALAPEEAWLPLVDAVLPSRVAVLASVDAAVPAGADLALALRGVASTVVLPSALPADVRARLLAAVERDRARLGVAAAVARAVEAEPASTPGIGGVQVLGAPGLDASAEVQFADRLQVRLNVRSLALVKATRFVEAVPAVDAYVRALGVVAVAHPTLYGAHNLLVTTYERASQWDRAAEAQDALVRFLEQHAKPELRAKNLLPARVKLGSLLSRAGDVAASEATLDAVERELRARDEQLTLASVLVGRGHAARQRNDGAAAAAAFERAITAYEAAGAYRAKEVSAAAQDAVRTLADLALNRLSDSARARGLYLRVLGYATTPEQRATAQLALARVARRRGELVEAAARAEAAAEAARLAKAPGLALEALIESTNIAWYRSDLAQGRALCARAQKEAEGQLVAARQGSIGKTDLQERRVIYALSVCGLIDMSSGDFTSAERTLLLAIRRARRAALLGEESTQYNNLGRVYLEFGRLPRAVEAFERAAAIDEQRNDRFGLAYDLRNLGTAQAALRRRAAEATLLRALALSVEVQDDNNLLRAQVALADLLREQGRRDEALARFTEALPVAARTDNLELGAHIHRSLGLLLRDRGDAAGAQAHLEQAVASSRRLPGRSGATEYGPHRFAAFDDLLLFKLSSGRAVEALAVAEEARAIAQLAFLDDERVGRAAPEVAAALATLRATTSASVAAAARAHLTSVAPAIAARLAPPDPAALAAAVPADAAVLCYRATDEGLVVFALADGTVTATVVPVTAAELGARLIDYRLRLEARGDVTAVQRALAAWLLAPVAPRITGKARLMLVLNGGLGVVGFAALPWGQGALLDAFTLATALDPAAAVHALSSPAWPLRTRAIAALAAPEGGAPIPFARHEVAAIREAQPQAVAIGGAQATGARLLAAAGEPDAVAHFAGHSRLVAKDPLASALETAGAPLALSAVVTSRLDAALVVLSACETLTPPDPALSPAAVARRAPVSLAAAFALAGAGSVLATTVRVDDVSAALLMKRFYRAAADRVPADALRAAQRVVRSLDPHPAAWATYALLMQ